MSIEATYTMVAPGTDWQLGCMELKQRGAHLLQSGQWSDCSFLVGSKPDQVTVAAHKLILASASPVFEAMFFGGMAEKDGPIEILDVQPDAFKTLLQYIYSDKTVICSFEKACSVYYTAKKYMLPYLEKECTWFISLNLNPQNVCRAYELAVLFDENLLMEKCIKIMVSQTKEVLNCESFEEADLTTLNEILSQDHLCIESELDLFRAVEKYAVAHSKCALTKKSIDYGDNTYGESPPKKARLSNKDEVLNLSAGGTDLSPTKLNDSKSIETNSQNVTAASMTPGQNESHENTTTKDMLPNLGDSGNDLNNNDNLQDSTISIERGFLRDAISKIRFLTLTAAQFAAGPARSPLLSERQAFALIMNILSTDSTVPMPKGFCTSRINRNQHTLTTEVPDSRSEAVFRFTVLNFKTRRRSVESRPFYCHDLPWALKLVPRVESSTNGLESKYFGLYLRCGGLEGGAGGAWSCGVRAALRVLAQAPQRHVTADLHRNYNSKEQEWGFERFVTWDDALSPERGLLKGNAITIEVHLRVHST